MIFLAAALASINPNASLSGSGYGASGPMAPPAGAAMVAFAAATMFARLYPTSKWLFYLLAWGCAVTRVLSRAHYISDVTFGALLGWAVGWGLYLQFHPREMKSAATASPDSR